MSQALQEEAQPEKDQVDQGWHLEFFPQIGEKNFDCRLLDELEEKNWRMIQLSC